jgi:hypothetical protein
VTRSSLNAVSDSQGKTMSATSKKWLIKSYLGWVKGTPRVEGVKVSGLNSVWIACRR